MIEIDLNLAVSYNLTLDEYVLLFLLNIKDINSIKVYFRDQSYLQLLLGDLEKRKFITKNRYSGSEPLLSYTVLQIPHYTTAEFDMWFKELISIYPQRVKRPDGNEDFLHVNISACKELYRKITKTGGKEKHDSIIKALTIQIKMMEQSNNLRYMLRLYKWLANSTWKDYESLATQTNNNITKNTYGQSLI